jgi:hypothetical protein
MDFMKDEDGTIKYYDTEEKAGLVCGIHELENAWVMKLIFNHIENKDETWFKTIRDKDGNRIYMESNDGVIFDNRK